MSAQSTFKITRDSLKKEDLWEWSWLMQWDHNLGEDRGLKL
jgi:hypothetical protein